MHRQVAVLLYPGCVFFEVALALEILARRSSVAFYTPDGLAHQASNGATLQVAGSYGDLERTQLDCVLVPGGDPASIIPGGLAAACLHAQRAGGALIGAICAGALVLASAGLLRGVRATHNYTPEHASPEAVEFTQHFWEGSQYVRADLVSDRGIITAQPWAYAKFAAAIAEELGVLSASQSAALIAAHAFSYDDV